MARRVEDGETWRKAGFKSAADQLALLSGTSINEAKAQIKTSKRVKKLPKTANAMRKGTLSPAKVDAIAGAANVDPDAEDKLLEGAEKKPLAQLREDCLKAKAKDRDKAHARIRRERYAREYRDGEGAWNFHARGTLDDGSDFRLEWKRQIDRQFKLAKAEGREEPLEAYAFDALIELARRSARADDPAPNTEPTKTATKTKRTPAKYLGIIRLDYEALVRGAVEGEEMCEIRGLGPIPVSVARELLGETILKLVDHQGRGRGERHPPWSVTHGGATGCDLVAITHVHPRHAAPVPSGSRMITDPNGEKRSTPASTSSTPSVTATTTSRPTTAGTSSKATAADPWSHPTTRDTPNTDHPSASDGVGAVHDERA